MKEFSLLSCFAIAATACGSGSSSEPSGGSKSHFSGSAVLTDAARVLDAPGLQALTSATADGELSFSEESPVLSTLDAGNVLIVGVSDATPQGALVVVDSVASEDGGVILTSHPAALDEAFEELHLSYATTVQAPLSLSVLAGKNAPKQQGLGFPLHLDASGDDGSVSLDGAVSLSPSMDFDLDIDFAELKLEKLALSFGATETFAATLTGTGSAAFDESTNLLATSFTPIVLTLPTPVGPVPLVLTPTLSLDARARGNVTGDVDASVVQEASFDVGLGYQDGSFAPTSKHDSTFSFDQPTYRASANAKLSAGPRFAIELYGAVGPFATAEAYVELQASADGPPPCARGTLDAGLSGTVGVDFIASYETSLFNQSYPLASFDSCSNDPNAPRPVATWARSFGRDGSDGERAKAVVELADGTLFVVGDSDAFDGVSGFAASIWALRLDALGNVMWQRAFQRQPLAGLPQGAAATADGVLVATTGGVTKLDPGGNVLWANQYASGDYLTLNSIAARPDGSSVVAGSIDDPAVAFAMGLDAAGNVSWSRSYGGTDFARVRVTSDGGSVLIGDAPTNDGDFFVVKLDAAGVPTWERAIDNAYDAQEGADPPVEGNPLSSSIDYGFDAVEEPSGGFLVVGQGYGAFPIPKAQPVGFFVAWQAELTPDGDLAGDVNVYQAPKDAVETTAYAAAVRPDGTSLILGRRGDSDTEPEDVLLIQGSTFTALGGGGTDAVLTGSLAGHAAPLILTQDGGAVVAATSDSFAGQNQFWVVKLSRTGSINFPYRSGLEGVTYANPHAAVLDQGTGATDVDVTQTDFASELQTEVTPFSTITQAP